MSWRARRPCRDRRRCAWLESGPRQLARPPRMEPVSGSSPQERRRWRGRRRPGARPGAALRQCGRGRRARPVGRLRPCRGTGQRLHFAGEGAQLLGGAAAEEELQPPLNRRPVRRHASGHRGVRNLQPQRAGPRIQPRSPGRTVAGRRDPPLGRSLGGAVGALGWCACHRGRQLPPARRRSLRSTTCASACQRRMLGGRTPSGARRTGFQASSGRAESFNKRAPPAHSRGVRLRVRGETWAP